MIYDITVPITTAMPVWPGDPPVAISPISQIAKGSRSNVSQLSLATHTGTHLDPPRHFIQSGDTLDQVALDTLIGPADVAYLPDAERIGAAELESLELPVDCQRLLLRTRNSLYWVRQEAAFQRDYVGVTAEGAEWLVKRGPRLVGIDYLSVARFEEVLSVHLALLEACIILLEGLNLYDILPGRYQLVCLPIKIAGGDGAPARAVLIA
jgi:arylformamidase